MSRICNEPAEITIPEIKDAEVCAMMQAMYSRSNTRIKVRLNELDLEGEEKAKQALSRYYIDYGHASINDCGFTTIFLEGVSNIVAKAIEDTQLFNGQESSTRYLDYSAQSIIDPYNKTESREIVEGWLHLYLKYQPMVIEGLMIRFPQGEGEDTGQYERAIKARSFDIMRGFLPSGVTTQLSWTTSLRHARDRIRFLKYHPCQEVRDVIVAIHAALLEKYPHSFKSTDIDVDVESDEYKFYSNWENHYIDYNHEIVIDQLKEAPMLYKSDCIVADTEEMARLFNIVKQINERPVNCRHIPTMFEDVATFKFLTYIDFGSFRDIQRHRKGWCPIPVVKDYGFGINKWYMSEVNESLSEEDFFEFNYRVESLLSDIEDIGKISDEDYCKFKHQYLFPMGINIITEFSYNFNQCIYVSELRSQPTVHETLRPIAQFIGKIVNETFGLDNICRVNNEPSAFNISRGKQTIFKDGKEIE